MVLLMAEHCLGKYKQARQSCWQSLIEWIDLCSNGIAIILLRKKIAFITLRLMYRTIIIIYEVLL